MFSHVCNFVSACLFLIFLLENYPIKLQYSISVDCSHLFITLFVKLNIFLTVCYFNTFIFFFILGFLKKVTFIAENCFVLYTKIQNVFVSEISTIEVKLSHQWFNRHWPLVFPVINLILKFIKYSLLQYFSYLLLKIS